MAWVIEGNLCKTPSKFRNFHGRRAVIVWTLPISKPTKADIYSLKARFSYFLSVFPLQSSFFQSKSGVKRWKWVNFSHFETVNSTSRRLCVTICSVTSRDITYVRRDGAVKMTVTDHGVVTQRNSWRSNIFDADSTTGTLKEKKSNALAFWYSLFIEK